MDHPEDPPRPVLLGDVIQEVLVDLTDKIDHLSSMRTTRTGPSGRESLYLELAHMEASQGQDGGLILVFREYPPQAGEKPKPGDLFLSVGPIHVSALRRLLEPTNNLASPSKPSPDEPDTAGRATADGGVGEMRRSD